jgi:hypothetical protein
MAPVGGRTHCIATANIQRKTCRPGGSLAQSCYYLLDEVRPGDEASGAPERVVDVGAERLQLRGEAAVDDRAPARSRHEVLQHPHPGRFNQAERSAARLVGPPHAATGVGRGICRASGRDGSGRETDGEGCVYIGENEMV